MDTRLHAPRPQHGANICFLRGVSLCFIVILWRKRALTIYLIAIEERMEGALPGRGLGSGCPLIFKGVE